MFIIVIHYLETLTEREKENASRVKTDLKKYLTRSTVPQFSTNQSEKYIELLNEWEQTPEPKI